MPAARLVLTHRNLPCHNGRHSPNALGNPVRDPSLARMRTGTIPTEQGVRTETTRVRGRVRRRAARAHEGSVTRVSLLRHRATAPSAIGWRHDVLASRCAHLRELRAGQSAGRRLLQQLRRGARDHGGVARGSQDGDGAVLRLDGLDGARGADRSGGAAGAAGALLRADEGDRRVARRHGREVHRRRGDGGVRRSRGARGRRAAGLPGGGGDARRAAGARDRRPDRREHGRGGDRDGGAARDRGRGQRRGALRAGCGAGRRC